MGCVTDDEGQRLHTLDERLGVMLAQVLTQSQTVLVDQGVIELSFRVRCSVIFPNLKHRQTTDI